MVLGEKSSTNSIFISTSSSRDLVAFMNPAPRNATASMIWLIQSTVFTFCHDSCGVRETDQVVTSGVADTTSRATDLTAHVRARAHRTDLQSS